MTQQVWRAAGLAQPQACCIPTLPEGRCASLCAATWLYSGMMKCVRLKTCRGLGCCACLFQSPTLCAYKLESSKYNRQQLMSLAKVQLLWKGREALISAMKLISAAELAASVDGGAAKPFVWRQPIMRPAVTRKQVGTAPLCRAPCMQQPCSLRDSEHLACILTVLLARPKSCTGRSNRGDGPWLLSRPGTLQRTAAAPPTGLRQ